MLNNNQIIVNYCPLKIILAHELIHALHASKGQIDVGKSPNKYVSKINKKYGTNFRVIEDFEELNTIGVRGFFNSSDITENKIRNEQGLLERITYYGIK